MKDLPMIDKLDRADVPVATAAATFPVWAQWLPFALQVALGVLGFVYLLMRIYRERLLTKLAQRRIDAELGDDIST